MPLTDYLLLIVIAIIQTRPINRPSIFLTKNSFIYSPSREILIHTGNLTAATALASISLLLTHFVLSTQANILTTLKITGAAYLTWLSVRQIIINTSRHNDNTHTIVHGALAALWTRSFISGIQQPGRILFFSALLLQLIDTPSDYQMSHLIQLIALFIGTQLLTLIVLTRARSPCPQRTLQSTLTSLKKIASACSIIFFWGNIYLNTHHSTAVTSSLNTFTAKQTNTNNRFPSGLTPCHMPPCSVGAQYNYFDQAVASNSARTQLAS